MKKNIIFGVIALSIGLVYNAAARAEGVMSYIKNNGSFQVGVGANYYNIEEKNGNDRNKASPIFNVGYKVDLPKKFFVDVNVNFDVAKLSSNFLFSDTEYCSPEDVLEGECSTVGSYKVTANGVDLDAYRIFDLNIGYNIAYGFSIFAGVNLYKIDYSYGATTFQAITSGLQAYDMESVDEGDDSAVGFSIGIKYDIKDTNFSTKLMYSQVSFDGGHIDAGGVQEIDDQRISLTLNYNF